MGELVAARMAVAGAAAGGDRHGGARAVPVRRGPRESRPAWSSCWIMT